MLKEFRDFIMTGNVIDLAVAVILASAVGMVVTGFTNDIMMPIVGHFVGGVDFADLKIVLSEAELGPDGTVCLGHPKRPKAGTGQTASHARLPRRLSDRTIERRKEQIKTSTNEPVLLQQVLGQR